MVRKLPQRLAVWVPMTRRSGLGHYYRNLALSQMIPDSFFVTEVIEVRVDAPVVEIGVEPSAEGVVQALNGQNVGVVLVDHYFLRSSLLREIFESPRRNFKIAFFDRDCTNEKYDAIINSNPFRAMEDFRLQRPATRYFVGAEYYQFRQEVAAEMRRSVERCTDRLFLNFGGGDRHGLAESCLERLDPRGYELCLVLGAGCSSDYVERVSELFAHRRFRGNLYWNPVDFAEKLHCCELAILPSSTICYEALALGVKTLCIQTEEHQAALAAFLRARQIEVCSLEQCRDVFSGPLARERFLWTRIQFGARSQELLAYISQELQA